MLFNSIEYRHTLKRCFKRNSFFSYLYIGTTCYINGRFLIPIIVALFIFFFRGRIGDAVQNLGNENYQEVLFLLFVVIAAIFAAITFVRSYSFIPIMGVLFCLYLMVEIPANSWFVFFCWMALGLLIYFLYGYRNSRLSLLKRQG